MSLIIGQAAVPKLPDELVKNAAFVKTVDFDPVHETGRTDPPGEKIHGTAPRFDELSISAEGRQALALNVDGAEPFVGRQPGEVLDITLPDAGDQGAAASRYMSGWNSMIAQLKEFSQDRDLSYNQTIKLFQTQTRAWDKSFQKTDSEAWQAWRKKLAEWGLKWL